MSSGEGGFFGGIIGVIFIMWLIGGFDWLKERWREYLEYKSKKEGKDELSKEE